MSYSSDVANASTEIEVAGSRFDVAAVGDWVSDNILLFLLFVGIAFLFWIFQKDGFASKFLDYRIRKRELDAKQLDDVRELADILDRKYGREAPLLPFDKKGGEKEP